MNWNLSNINDIEIVCYRTVGEGAARRTEMRPTTTNLLAAAHAVGMRMITRSNAVEFYARITLLERVGESLAVCKDEFGRRYNATTLFQIVEDHIGLMSSDCVSMNAAEFGKVVSAAWMRSETMLAASAANWPTR